MNIQRYETVGYASDTVKHDTGKYVKWEDVEKLLALRTAEAAELDLRRHAELSGYYARATLANALNNTNAARRAAGVEQ